MTGKELSGATASRSLAVKTPKMFHYVDERRPGFALCGFKLTRIYSADDPRPVDCVVCVELDEAFPQSAQQPPQRRPA